MNRNKVPSGSIIITILILSILCTSLARASNETESIALANSSINIAFTNVHAAQQAGANITELLARLNDGATLLTQAINSYNGGNMANVTSDSESARAIADKVNNDAIDLKNGNIAQSKNNLLVTCLLSISTALIFVFLLFLIWRRFKRSYLKKILDLKPKGVENAS